MNIVKILVIQDFYGPDYVYLISDLPSTMPNVTKEPLTAKVTVERGKGVEYVREHFGMEPEVSGRYPASVGPKFKEYGKNTHLVQDKG